MAIGQQDKAVIGIYLIYPYVRMEGMYVISLFLLHFLPFIMPWLYLMFHVSN